MCIQDVMHGFQILSENRKKANLFNEYFCCVFLPVNDMAPEISRATFDVMDFLEIRVTGIKNLLKNINEMNAAGPDGISSRVINLCAGETALYLLLMCSSTLATGKLPVD